ncbi:MAG: GNAT family N-acetyltransferase [Candidatus Heimdallarchaeota archaeon]
MTAELPNLLRVKKKHLSKAVKTFSRSFINDPLTVYMFPDEEERKEFMRHYFRFRVKYGIIYGEVYATSENIEGIAIWIHPKNTKMTMWKMFRSGGMKLYMAMGRKVIEKMFEIEGYTSKLHHKGATEPHWHLTPIGVDPEHQGKGYASKLIRAMLKKTDKENIPCYLETQNGTNVEIYKRYGFKVIDKVKIPKAELDHWTMIRKPE